MNINLDLNRLIIETNMKYTGNDPNLINFKYLDDNSILVSKGGTTYFIENAKLNKILTINEVDLKNTDKVYDVLAKHISNQLEASLGKKVYPEIKSDSSDNI